ncbi:hypothetical protein DM02DRAFT_665642 [Periconia macrospinosa]|uniref:Uncharacterized protein n=1 Tax=Periconia macrospinosa TaxID=97972 RepID=A0A2V1CWE7_9PLEO|nr:hypothetical protein DM02DRAFT_665642 [Periconia macrospinosa]
MHALVQLATREWLGANSRLEQWRREFTVLMAREFPSGGRRLRHHDFDHELARASVTSGRAAMSRG